MQEDASDKGEAVMDAKAGNDYVSEASMEEYPDGGAGSIYVKAHRRKKKMDMRTDDISGLPVERIDHELPPESRICPDCGCVMNDIGAEKYREVELIPARYTVKEHVVHTYACRHCDRCSDHCNIIKAPAPKPIIPKAMATPSAVAFICVQKYIYSVPIYRLEQGFIRDGFFLSRQTMIFWVIKCVKLYLNGIYQLLLQDFVKEPVIHCDETTLQVIHEPNRTAAQKSYEWVLRTAEYAEHAIVIYVYKKRVRRKTRKNCSKGLRDICIATGTKCIINCLGQRQWAAGRI
jgi:transposase